MPVADWRSVLSLGFPLGGEPSLENLDLDGQRRQAQFIELRIDITRPAMITVPLDAGLERGVLAQETPDSVAQLPDMFRLIGEGDGGQRRCGHGWAMLIRPSEQAGGARERRDSRSGGQLFSAQP